jgi:aminomethyltransferase
MTLRRTALHDRHSADHATLADFGGWEMPIEYSGTIKEHTAVRESVGIFDVSHMGLTMVSGAGATDWLNTVLANDLDRIASGQAQYTLLCNDEGGVIDDLIAYRLSDDEVMLIPNAANSDEVVAVLLATARGTDIVVTDARIGMNIVAVQGPNSDALLTTLGITPADDYMTFINTHWNDHDITVCRTGYTGERGCEIIISDAGVHQLWDALVAHGATPAGLGARDTLRTEMGYPLHGHEINATISPVQARLNWAIGWEKPTFKGAAALRAERERGPQYILRGLLAVDRAIPRPGMNIFDGDDNQLGVITSGTFSPTLRQGIGLALMTPSVTEADVVFVDVRGRRLPFTVVRPPFVAAHVR